MSNIRPDVCTEAARWKGTPYHSHARCIGVGVDCVHHLCAVLEAVGLISPTDPGFYAPQWHLHRSEERYAAALDQVAQRTDRPQPGDIVLFRFGRTLSHGGFLVEGGDVIHALNRHGQGLVMQTSLDQAPLARRERVFWDITTIKRA